jgi:hypothetical protein
MEAQLGDQHVRRVKRWLRCSLAPSEGRVYRQVVMGTRSRVISSRSRSAARTAAQSRAVQALTFVRRARPSAPGVSTELRLNGGGERREIDPETTRDLVEVLEADVPESAFDPAAPSGGGDLA